MRKTRVALALMVTGMATGFLVSPWKTKPVMADDDKRIVIRDDCDPDDVAGWASTGGCALEEGDVNRAEFDTELASPLSLSVIGHQAWWNDPPYLKIETGDTVNVRNKGGRVHTFTEVADFGGGRIPVAALNKGLTTAPECPTSVDIAPGAGVRLSDLTAGNHKFQCCIHPWMRAIVKVKAEEDDEDNDDH